MSTAESNGRIKEAQTEALIATVAADEVVEQPKYSREVTLLTMLSVLLVMLLASLDQTIVGTAMPRIIADLNGFSEYTWVTTAYLLTSTVMVPIYGKLSDLYGRKGILIFAVIVFLIGSWLSGAAQTMTMLILFRGFQGLGAGGLMSMAIAIIGDLFTPRERAKWQGVTGAVFMLAFIVGPTAGGWITDNLSWRWVFYVNMPIGLIALGVLIFLMPTLYRPAQNPKIDFVGATLLILGTVPLLLGLTWGGSQYDWNSPQIIGLLGGAVIALVAFILYERRLEANNGQPIVSPSLFKNNVFAVSTIIVMLAGMAMMGSIYYIPLFLQGVTGVSATASGTVLTPMMITAIVASIASGLLVARTGRYKIFALAGAVISVVGSFFLLHLDVHSTSTDVIIAMLVLGLGMGTAMSLYNLIVQNALPTRIGEASAGMTFFRQIGSTIGLAAMGSVFNSTFPTAFHNAIPAAITKIVPAQVINTFNNPQILLSPEALAALHAQFAKGGAQGLLVLDQLLEAVKVGIASSLHSIFFVGMIIAVASVVAVIFLKELPLSGGARPSVMPEGVVESAESAEPDEEPEAAVSL
ncbi:MAG TPA: MDR family MFS transporter [Ktedonobacterales bacterium]|nr:MDR family MFS transporter [Ktedonobacterales bacterium]